MRERIVVALISLAICGCTGGGGEHPPPADLLSLPPLDLMSAPTSSPDMSATPPCVSPKPGAYAESVYYYVPIGSSNVAFDPSNTVIVRTDGRIVRSSLSISSVQAFRCSFTDANVDYASCTAPCCPGQPQSPLVYVDAGGWTIWLTGSCSFTTSDNISYVATVSDASTQFLR